MIFHFLYKISGTVWCNTRYVDRIVQILLSLMCYRRESDVILI